MIGTIMLIGVGGFFILLGLAAKKYPDLIAGYNTMSPQKKRGRCRKAIFINPKYAFYRWIDNCCRSNYHSGYWT